MWWEITSYVATAIGAGASVCGIIQFFRRQEAKRSRIADEVELMRAAHNMIEIHGDNALDVAAMHAFKLFDQGDLEGFRAWKRIARVVDEMTSGISNSRRLSAEPVKFIE